MAETISNGTAKASKPRAKKATETLATPSADFSVDPAGATDNVASAKSRFSKAVEEAKAGAEALRDEVVQRGSAYKEKLAGKTGDLQGSAQDYTSQAKEKATAIAREGKARASDALAAVGKTIADTAPTVDDKLGSQYGDYARSAARWTQEAAAKLEAKDIGELGDDVKEFVRKSPGAAIGIAAVAGFVVARMLSGGGGSDD